MTSQTVVMYSPDTVGLGHVRRNSTIAARLVERRKDCSVVLLMGSAMGQVFALPPGVDSIKLPSVQKGSTGDWCPRSLGVSSDVVQRVRSGLIRETIANLRPAVFLVDHLPTGIWGELLPIFEFIRAKRLPTRIVLGLRDILDEPSRVSDRWSRDGIYDVIRRYYDSIYIYGDPRVFDSATSYGLGEDVSPDVRYMGYVSSRSPAARWTAPSGNRERSERLVVVTAGGGYDAYPMMAASLEALSCLPTGSGVRAVAVAGPLMPEEYFARLRVQAEAGNVELLRFTPQLGALLDAASLVITMGGYNSMLEITALGKPTIVIPRSGPSMEQTVRSRLFEQIGLSRHVPIDAASPTYLAQAIMSGLEQIPNPLISLPLDGAAKAADSLAADLASAANGRGFEQLRPRHRRIVQQAGTPAHAVP